MPYQLLNRSRAALNLFNWRCNQSSRFLDICGFNIVEHNAGVNTSAIIAEITTETAIVNANCL